MSGLSADNLRWALTAREDANWFPLTWISLMADCHFFGITAGPQHWTNVILHAAATLLLLALLKRLTGAIVPSAMVAFLFALHPLRVESVAWVAERKDVLSALFWMLALAAYGWYAARPRPGPYVLTLLFYCLGFLAKPMVVTLPAVLLLLDVWPLRRISRAALREKLPFFALALLMAAIAFEVQRHGGAVRSLDAVPLSARLENALISPVAYLLMTLWPTRLAVFYPMPAQQPVWDAMAAALVLLGVTWLVLHWLRPRPYLAVGWFWFLITLLPVIGLVQVGDQARADRYTYIPGIGLAIMLAWGGAEAWASLRPSLRPMARPVLAALGGAAGLACVALTWWQVFYWQNSVTLFQHAVAVTDNNPTAHNSLGNAYREQLLYDDALAEYRKALAADPRYVASLVNLGAVLGLQGHSAEAIAPLSDAVHLRPGSAPTRYALGLALAIAGRENEALAQFDAAIRLQPDYADAHASRGTALANLGRMDEAIREFSEALRIQPGLADARRNLQKALDMRDSGARR
jgi:hypothetical protein